MTSRAATPITRLGLQIPSFTYPGVPPDGLFQRVAEIAGTAERSGFDSVWVMDHFYQIGVQGPRTEPMLEAYTLLGGIAARTERVRLGAMVTGVTYRNPALLAKTVTTLDTSRQAARCSGSGPPGTRTSTGATGSSFRRCASGSSGSRRPCRSAGRCSPRRRPASRAAATTSTGR